MDKDNYLAKDTIEQLLKFVPTQEEEALLNESSSELMNMAEPDRFLFDMSKVFHYNQKLEALYFMKKYSERRKELAAKLTQTIYCCKCLLANNNIPKLFQIILALGNYMNQGHRNGTVFGFSVSNLNKLIDIKSSTDKSYSMLHYLIKTIDQKVNFCLLCLCL